MPPNTLGVLEDILEAAQYIADDTAGMTFDDFQQDRRSRQLVAHNFTIIGEAMNRLRRHDASIAAQISSRGKIVAFRNSLIHGYDMINYGIVWAAIQDDPPALRSEVLSILGENHSPSTNAGRNRE